jgi:hypothetical protein
MQVSGDDELDGVLILAQEWCRPKSAMTCRMRSSRNARLLELGTGELHVEHDVLGDIP